MARIIRQNTVIRDGWHNAFTDLAYWQGHFLVSYRKGGGHISRDGEAVVAVSPDGHRFREVGNVKINGDTRDPKLVPMTEDRIAMILPTWVGGVRSSVDGVESRLEQYVTFSDNGFDWEKPQRTSNDPNRWLWRARKVGEKFLGLEYGWEGDKSKGRRYLMLVESDDMISWKPISQIGEDHGRLGESDLFVHEDGEMWVVSRSAEDGKESRSYFLSAKPPYTDWEMTQLDCLIQSPIILEHKGRLFVSGRRSASIENDDLFPFLSRKSLGVWQLDRGKVKPVMHIPATGDCAYPGLIEHNNKVYMSYYSQHAYDMGVVDYKFSRDVDPPKDGKPLSMADVYFAILNLD